MNTNDPAAKYGKPMLSDDGIKKLVDRWIAKAKEQGEETRMVEVVMCDPPYPASLVRDFYENLIHEGRLKVVEECRVKIDTSPGEWNGMHLLGCNGRGPVTDEVFCPYCGNRIIKPTNP